VEKKKNWVINRGQEEKRLWWWLVGHFYVKLVENLIENMKIFVDVWDVDKIDEIRKIDNYDNFRNWIEKIS